MTETVSKTTPRPLIEKLFAVGAHFGYNRSRRHPSASAYIFGTKQRTEIIDLEKTADMLASAEEVVKNIAKNGGNILLVGGKSEARTAVKNAGIALAMPYVAGRWIGGSLTNFTEIRRRLEKHERLTTEREKGELAKYTKRERLLIDKDIERLDDMYGGLLTMKDMPKLMVVIDPKKEHIAVEEAKQKGIPVLALLNSDCNMKDVTYPVLANDASKACIEFFLDAMVKAYEAGRVAKVEAATVAS
jgi:small subunit ribosomal protein S2